MKPITEEIDVTCTAKRKQTKENKKSNLFRIYSQLNQLSQELGNLAHISGMMTVVP